MKEKRVIKSIFIISLSIAIIFPLFNIFFVHPFFSNLLIENTIEETEDAAKHLASMLFVKEITELAKDPLPDWLSSDIERIEHNFNLVKLKVFSPSGEILYSTDPKDIGGTNKETYFQEIVAKGNTYTTVVKKNSRSLENQVVIADVVETYVPVMRNGSFQGALELYYDITARNQQLSKAKLYFSVLPFGITINFLVLILFCLFELNRTITKRKQVEEKLQTLSLTDELTGIYNRRGFFVLAEQQFKIAKRQKSRMFLLYADIDNMKYINDVLGHQEGDLALIEVANVLKATYRDTDIIARMGGDEFVVFPVGTTEEYVDIITARLQQNLESHNAKKGRNYGLLISVGIASYDPEAPCSIDELLARGDTLMYEQKRQKKKS